MAKRKPKFDSKSNLSQVSPDLIIQSLKERYFRQAALENYPNTPEITKEVDNLEGAIKEFLSEKATQEANK